VNVRNVFVVPVTRVGRKNSVGQGRGALHSGDIPVGQVAGDVDEVAGGFSAPDVAVAGAYQQFFGDRRRLTQGRNGVKARLKDDAIC